MSSIHSDIVNMQNATQAAKAQQPKEASSSVSSNDFLFLLTQQLQYQDPMNPMDNSQMLAQEAQFATLEQMEALTRSFSQFSNVFQANALIGQNVEVQTSSGEGTSGTVEYVDFTDSNGAAVSIGGKLYPLSSVTKVYPAGTDNASGEDTNFFKEATQKIGSNIENIAQKLTSYLGSGT